MYCSAATLQKYVLVIFISDRTHDYSLSPNLIIWLKSNHIPGMLCVINFFVDKTFYVMFM